ncbi:MAG TPA: adenine deaminase [Tenuifilaceae bacterium]|nr:adenine deaminase [Tenuifilaceae bacterium]HPJ44845.1 adenine deaminase [Tenuifilaceae bacterium]HPQ32861.1 adenine deaminase [Tenuifilaceae bacterium]HRX67210.1 adenine deaminase [Tenuifilaceae bacterium]
MNKEVTVVKGVLVSPELRTKRGVEIVMSGGRIIEIKNCPNVNKPFILPGFIDSHIHIESSMLIPSAFARMAVRHGTVAVVTDPHEVANVAGIDGIRFMVNDAKQTKLKFFFGIPSCVPASPIEKSGAVLGAEKVESLLKENDFYFLAEMMNFPGVVFNDKDVHRKLNAAKKVGKPIDGHAPGLSGVPLEQYVNSGISTDHECSTTEEAIEKIGLGMKIQIREGSAAKNFEKLIPIVKSHKDSVMFCTDDCHPDYLQKGHINKIVARAIELGYDLYEVLQIACINPINHYKIPIGKIEVNCKPDFTVVNDLVSFDVIETYIDGEKIFGQNEVFLNEPKTLPNSFYFRDELCKEELKVTAKSQNLNVIGVIDGELITKWIKETVLVPIGSVVDTNPQQDLLKIVLLDRYSNSKPIVGFIRGFGIKKGAIAASIAHDSHHIISVGCDDESIYKSLTWIIDSRGGICYTHNETQGIPLPFYGLMTSMDGDKVSQMYQELNNLVKENGCTLESPFMTASFMALTVIPELKIYHKGLFDSTNFKHVDLFI